MSERTQAVLPVDSAMAEFHWPVRVYYEDTDAAGVVYHSNYLKYMERARTEWLRAAGYSQVALVNEDGIVFVVSNMNVDFILPARFDEMLNVHSAITAVEGPRMVFRQSVLNEEGRVKCRGEVTIVCVEAAGFRPRRIPEHIKAKLLNDI